jgi:chromosome segregation ATPase
LEQQLEQLANHKTMMQSLVEENNQLKSALAKEQEQRLAETNLKQVHDQELVEQLNQSREQVASFKAKVEQLQKDKSVLQASILSLDEENNKINGQCDEIQSKLDEAFQALDKAVKGWFDFFVAPTSLRSPLCWSFFFVLRLAFRQNEINLANSETSFKLNFDIAI